jgi:TetR/AcrR family transcriptional repressor of nem operon
MTRHTDTKQTLIEAGLATFRANGYDATGVKELTDAAKVPKGSFHYHFPDGKEAFAADVVDRYRTDMLTHGERVLASGEAPLVRIWRYFDEVIPVYEVTFGCAQGCLLGNFSAEMADRSPAIRQSVKTAFAAWQEQFAAVLAEAKAAGALGSAIDPQELAGFLIDAWEGALLRMKAEHSVAPLRRFQTFVLEPFMPR